KEKFTKLMTDCTTARLKSQPQLQLQMLPQGHQRRPSGSTTFIKPHFPPNLTPRELMANAEEKLRKTGQLTKTPNAFLTYRMALQKEFATLNLYPNMRELSTAAGNAWEREPEYVKAHYNRLMLEARALFQSVSQAALPLQFVHVNPNNSSNQNPHYRTPYGDVEENWNTSEINTDTNERSPSYINLATSINSASMHSNSRSSTSTSTFMGYNQNSSSNEDEMNSSNSFHLSDPTPPASGYQQLDYLAVCNEANCTSSASSLTLSNGPSIFHYPQQQQIHN
ncbi:10531_t:CDS:1, partial [Ambispora leptoticha]